MATSPAPPARATRAAVRGFARLRARVRSGSVAAEMDRIVAEALEPSRGSALDPALRHRRGRRRMVRTAPGEDRRDR